MDCPQCSRQVDRVAGMKKHERQPILRRFQGGVKIIGRYGCTDKELTSGVSVGEGAILVEQCQSCKWTSVHRHDGDRIQLDRGKKAIPWRLVECGHNVDVNAILRKYGFKAGS